MTSFYWTCWELAQVILKALALGLGIDEELMMKPHSGHYNQLRLLHYPPIPANQLEGGRFARMPAHTDWTTITMLFQDDCGGLQVERAGQPGVFVDAEPVEGTLVLNVGDLLMRWSNGELDAWFGDLDLTTCVQITLSRRSIGCSCRHCKIATKVRRE